MKTAQGLAALYAATDQATREHGRDWYRLSERDIRRLARELPNGRGQSAAAAIFAALSPRQAYRQNWEAAWAIARYRQAGAIRPPRTGLGDARDKAWRIAWGGDPDEVLGGEKVRSFWRALAGDPDAVVIDVWMCRVMGVDQEKLTPRTYAEITRRFRQAAASVGESARDLQAILWFHARGYRADDPKPGQFRPARSAA